MVDRLPTVLIVDDDETFRNVLSRELRDAGFTAQALASGEEVENALLESTYDVVVLDLKMPGMDGVATLARIKDVRPLTEVVILTGHGSLESAVRALKLGAYDFLTKPCDLDRLESVIRRAAQSGAMRSENAALRQALSRHGEGTELVGRSAAVERVRELVRKVAPTSATVLIRGESGSGKEVVARAIHRLGPRRDRPFVVLDCGATQESLALSELFGHEKGAYTGAVGRKHGLFELANSGTILVDEIGDAPMSLQTRLLRVLETGAFRRLGGLESIRVDVQILASTHRDLERSVRDGTFREDLYYRLNVFSIHVPPLRERPEDIEPLAHHFLGRLHPGSVPAIGAESLSILRSYAWPGNVRELRNVIERAVILCEGGIIRPRDLPLHISARTPAWETADGEEVPTLQEVERRYLRNLMARFQGDRARVAAALGLSQRTLYRKLRHLTDQTPGQS